MPFFIVVIGLIQIIAGVGVFMQSKSAVHEILGAITFGFGVLSIALGLILVRLDQLFKNAEAQIVEQRALNSSLERVAEAFDRIGR